MKSARLASACILMMLPSVAQADMLVLDSRFTQADGAIRTFPEQESLIDPYFTTKALLLAADGGLDVRTPAQGWINWMLANQQQDGLFARHCYNDTSNAHDACIVADADDVMMAMWVEMLYRMAPAAEMKPLWKASAFHALVALDGLYDEATGLYFVSKEMQVGLLIDNVEIYAALKRTAKEAKRLGQPKEAQGFSRRADMVKAGIMRTLWNAEEKRFRVSTQKVDFGGFYPAHVAQIVPLMHGFTAHMGGALNNEYEGWMAEYEDEWMALVGRDYPWGVVAVMAAQRGDIKRAACWLNAVHPLRASNQWWNILEEAAYQVVDAAIRKTGKDAVALCSEVKHAA